jgi:hypothetical protein
MGQLGRDRETCLDLTPMASEYVVWVVTDRHTFDTYQVDETND